MSQNPDTDAEAKRMLREALSDTAMDEQSLETTLELALLEEAPDLARDVLGQYRAAKSAGHPEAARELLASAVQVVRSIQQIDSQSADSTR